MSRWCLNDVSVVSQWCLGVVLVMSRSCLCPFLLMSPCCFGVVLLVLCWCFGDCFSDVLVASRCFGEVSMMCGDGAVMFMIMSGWLWWLGVVSLMLQCCFLFFGDGVLIVWWWTLMNILIGFLSKIQNSNLNLYIVHLWANQCSCGSYVVGWCFKCFDVLGTSRACFGEISVMCVDGAVMFMMMSGWWLGVVSLMLQCRCFSLVMVFWLFGD